MSVNYPQIGDPVFDEAIADMARQIVLLQRQVAALQLSGGRGAGCYIGTVQSGGIPAATDDDTPGVGNIMIRQVYGQYGIRDSGIVVPCLNIARGALGPVDEGKQIVSVPILNRPGHHVVILDPCPPA